MAAGVEQGCLASSDWSQLFRHKAGSALQCVTPRSKDRQRSCDYATDIPRQIGCSLVERHIPRHTEVGPWMPYVSGGNLRIDVEPKYYSEH